MKNKYFIVGALIAATILNLSACSFNTGRNDPPSTLPDGTSTPSADTVMSEFKSLITTNSDVSLKELAEFIKNNIEFVKAEDASKMVLRFEELQKSNLAAFENELNSEEIQKKFQEQYKADTDLNVLENIKDPALFELVSGLMDAGYKAEQAEGSFFPVVDYSFYKSFSAYTTDDIKEYLGIMAIETDTVFARDAELSIGWDEVVNRAIRQEKFIKDYPGSQKADDIKALYKKYERITFYGLDNSPVIDESTKVFDEEAKKAYETAIAGDLSSGFLDKLEGFIDVLSKNNNRLTDEVEGYRNYATGD